MSELSGLYKRQGETRSKFYGGRGRTKSFSDAIGFSRGSANLDIQDSIRTGKNIQDNILMVNELVNYSEDVSSTRSKAKEAIDILSKGSENKFEQISGGDTTLKNLWGRRGDFFKDPTLLTEIGQKLAHFTGITDPKYSFDGKTYTTDELAAMLGYLKAGFSADYLNPNNNRADDERRKYYEGMDDHGQKMGY